MLISQKNYWISLFFAVFKDNALFFKNNKKIHFAAKQAL